MIFFNKKRIVAISLLLLAVTLICLINPFVEPESKETVALPVSNKVEIGRASCRERVGLYV